MSFMAGFGESFSKSYTQAQDHANAKEQDAFRLSYNDYISRRDKSEQRETERAAAVRKAKALAESAGKSEAWTNAYEWVSAGLDEKTIMQNLQTGTFEPNQVERPEAPTGAVEQTQAAIGEENPATIPQAQAQSNGGIWGGIRDKLLGPARPKGVSNNPARDPQVQQIAEATGRTYEEVDQIMKGTGESADEPVPMKFTPAAPKAEKDDITTLPAAMIELEQARTAAQRNPTAINQERFNIADQRVGAIKEALTFDAKTARLGNAVAPTGYKYKDPETGKWKLTQGQIGADGAILDLEGNPIMNAVEVGDDERKDYFKIASTYGPQVLEFEGRANSAQDLLRDVAEMNHIVETAGDGVLTATAEYAATAEGWFANAKAAMDVFSGERNEDGTLDPTAVANAEAEVENAIAELERNPTMDRIQKLGTARSLLEMKAQLAAYKLASMMGQTGRGLAEAERKIFQDIMTGGNTGDKFRERMASLVFSQVNQLENEGKGLQQANMDIQAFEQFYGWSPFAPVKTVNERLLEDPLAAKAYEMLKELDPTPRILNGPSDAAVETQKEQAASAPAQPPAGASREQLQEWFDALPPGPFVDPGDGEVYIKE